MRLRYCLPLVLVAAVGCGTQHQGNSGASDGQNRPSVQMPTALRTGTGTAEQAEAWSKAVLKGSGTVDRKECALSARGVHARFHCYRGSAGSGGNVYAVFLSGPQGYRYIGTLEFGEYCVLPPDAEGRPRLGTLWYRGIGEGVLSMHVVTDNGLEKLAQKTVVPGEVFDTPLGGLKANKVLAIFNHFVE